MAVKALKNLLRSLLKLSQPRPILTQFIASFQGSLFAGIILQEKLISLCKFVTVISIEVLSLAYFFHILKQSCLSIHL